jgi:DNA helicase-2/ATP-dependent DNA helicase PcrA
MYVGTVHALCARLIEDRRFSPNRIRLRSPALLDDLAQLLHIYKTSRWNDLIAAAGLQCSVTNSVNKIFGSDSSNRFEAAANCISFFNLLSEECRVVIESRPVAKPR